MKAIVQDTYGSADVLETPDIDKPVAGDGEVLVRVHAAGVSPGVWHLMAGVPYVMRMGSGLRKPKARPGMDLAGRVEAVGKDVTQFQPGDDVFGTCDGAFAEYACAREDRLVSQPANLTFEQAAAVPDSACTALRGLRDAGKVEPEQKVLIIGAAGGIGTFAVQIAKGLGAEVTGVCSTTKTELVRSIGADHAIDYTQEDFADNGQRYGRHPRYRGPSFGVTPQTRPRPAGDPRAHRRRGRRPLVRRYGPPTRGGRAVGVRASEAPRAGLSATSQRGSAVLERTG